MKSFQERLSEHHSQVFTVDEVMYRGRTAHQDVLIFRNRLFGTVVALDGIVQLTERDNHIYHEMIAHVPLLAHGHAKRVLIIGGGDGGTLREVLKHPVVQATLVEIDREVIELAQRFVPDVAGNAFRDPRTRVIVGDGVDYVARTGSRFDVIIVDSTDPVGPGEELFSEAFYRACRKLLPSDGIIAVQSGTPFYQPDQLENVCARLATAFPAVSPFLAPVPTYAGGMLALVTAGPSRTALRPPSPILQARFPSLAGKVRYYTPDVHEAAFRMAPAFASDASAVLP